MLVEPTSAVDAHTEARIAQALRRKRGTPGHTTVVVTASPLLLGAMDTVVFLKDGKLHAQGTHRQLLETVPDYRRVVVRGEGMDGHGTSADSTPADAAVGANATNGVGHSNNNGGEE